MSVFTQTDSFIAFESTRQYHNSRLSRIVITSSAEHSETFRISARLAFFVEQFADLVENLAVALLDRALKKHVCLWVRVRNRVD